MHSASIVVAAAASVACILIVVSRTPDMTSGQPPPCNASCYDSSTYKPLCSCCVRAKVVPKYYPATVVAQRCSCCKKTPQHLSGNSSSVLYNVLNT